MTNERQSLISERLRVIGDKKFIQIIVARRVFGQELGVLDSQLQSLEGRRGRTVNELRDSARQQKQLVRRLAESMGVDLDG